MAEVEQMADYFSTSILTDHVVLTEELKAELEGEEPGTGEGRAKCQFVGKVEKSAVELVVDGVEEKPALVLYHVSWESSEDGSFPSTEGGAELLRRILLLNPQLSFLKVNTGYSCNALRAEGFGGWSLTVTSEEWLYIGSDDSIVDPETGKITARISKGRFKKVRKSAAKKAAVS
jgi:hypothetical protein